MFLAILVIVGVFVVLAVVVSGADESLRVGTGFALDRTQPDEDVTA